MFMEMTKNMTISSKWTKIRNHKSGSHQEYEKKKKSIVLLASHYASWEWLLVLNQK
jgi:KDO2-lipid IV(A) lauroyltransferase